MARAVACLLTIGAMALGETRGEVTAPSTWSDEELDPALGLEKYEVRRGVWGMLRLAGSDIPEEYLVPMLKRFRQFYPFVRTRFEGSSSNAAPEALRSGSVEVGLMSRRMREEERARLEAAWGHPPTSVRLCMDALAVVTHADNPIDSLSEDDLLEVFAEPREVESWERPRSWGALSASLGRWGEQELTPYGRTVDSGTRRVFERMVLGGRNFADDGMTLLSSNRQLMLAVQADRGAVAYASRSVLAPGLEIVPIRRPDGTTVSPLDDERCREVSYPYVRFLYAYFRRQRGEPVPAVVEEFLRYHFSWEGQTLVKQAGFIPMPAAQGQVLVEELLRFED